MCTFYSRLARFYRSTNFCNVHIDIRLVSIVKKAILSIDIEIIIHFNNFRGYSVNCFSAKLCSNRMINNQTYLNVQESVVKITKIVGSEARIYRREIVELPLSALKLICEILIELLLLLLIGLGFLILHFMICVLFVTTVSLIVSGRSPRIIVRGIAREIRNFWTRRRCTSTTRAIQTNEETIVDWRQGNDNPYYGSVVNVV